MVEGDSDLGWFYFLGFADAVTQNLLTQNCVGSPFEPSVLLSRFADAVTQRRKTERRAVSRGARARATRYLPGSLSLKRRADGHDPSGSFSNAYIPIYARSHRAQQAYMRHTHRGSARNHTTDTTHSVHRGLGPAEHNGDTRNMLDHPKPQKQAHPPARFASLRCPRAPGPVSATLVGKWHPGASGHRPFGRSVGSHMGPRPSWRGYAPALAVLHPVLGGLIHRRPA